jgi:putative transposase
MSESNRLSESTERIDLEFVERERTPRAVIEKCIRHHLAGLSLGGPHRPVAADVSHS